MNGKKKKKRGYLEIGFCRLQPGYISITGHEYETRALPHLFLVPSPILCIFCKPRRSMGSLIPQINIAVVDWNRHN